MPELLSGDLPWRRSRIVVPVTSPAAGADWSLVVPAGHAYRILSAMAVLTTSATVANRVPRLVYNDGAVDYLFVPPIASLAAGATARYSWFEHAGGQNVGNGQSISIPTEVLEAGGVLKVNTTALDATDQWSAIFVRVLDTTERRGEVGLGEASELTVAVVAMPPS